MGLHHANRQKRSVAVDLKSAAGHEVFRRLVAASDVMLTNYLEPVRKRLKIDVSDVRAVNADIIYAPGERARPAWAGEGPARLRLHLVLVPRRRGERASSTGNALPIAATGRKR